jgi:hypothetical protein
MPLDLGGLESFNQQPRRLIEEIESMSQLTSGQRVASVDCGVLGRAAGFALVVLILAAKKQKDVRICIGQACNVLYQRPVRGDFQG